MQYADPSKNWVTWLAENDDRDEDTQLAALREYIFALATEWNGMEDITAEWLNKKLAKLGITERIYVEKRYRLGVDVTGRAELTFYGANRAEVLSKVIALLNGTTGATVGNVEAAGSPVFLDGPEDEDPTVDPDAPTTVADTLTKLREIILLGHIAGPKYCKPGADRVLAAFGLDPIPMRKQFVVRRPVEAVMVTTVDAYDEESAQRVGDWRWENNRTAYKLVGGTETGDAAVASS